jgi:hypothetical protein
MGADMLAKSLTSNEENPPEMEELLGGFLVPNLSLELEKYWMIMKLHLLVVTIAALIFDD